MEMRGEQKGRRTRHLMLWETREERISKEREQSRERLRNRFGFKNEIADDLSKSGFGRVGWGQRAVALLGEE